MSQTGSTGRLQPRPDEGHLTPGLQHRARIAKQGTGTRSRRLLEACSGARGAIPLLRPSSTRDTVTHHGLAKRGAATDQRCRTFDRHSPSDNQYSLLIDFDDLGPIRKMSALPLVADREGEMSRSTLLANRSQWVII